MTFSSLLSRFTGILLDVNSTFMFGEDRYGPEQDYLQTYRSLGGRTLAEGSIRVAVDACIARMKALYVDPGRCDSFPQVHEVLTEIPDTRQLPADERRLLEQVIASHEVGHVPEKYADALQEFARTHRLGIVSNIWSAKDLWLDELSRVGVLDLFDTIVFSSDGASMKPSRRLFRQALDGLGLPPSDVVFVGDSLRCDVAGAAHSGLATVWIDRHGKGLPIEGPHPDYVVRDLLDLCPARLDAPSRRVTPSAQRHS
jgi:putative hydrolase of the HAD superfamily